MVNRTYSYKIRHHSKYSKWIDECLSRLSYVYNLAKQTKEDSYTAGLSLSCYDLSNQFTQCKRVEGFKWLNEIPAQTSQAVIEKLDRTFKQFYKGGGYPKWASKKRWKSIPFKTIKQLHNGFFKLPKIGVIKVFKPSKIEGDLRTASIVKEADGYYLKVVVEVSEKSKPTVNKDVAIDRGLVYLGVSSDGEYFENPRINKRSEKRLRILNRKLSRTKKGSNNRVKVINKLQRLHLKRRRQRTDFLHKLTSSLAKQYSTIYLEDLKTSKMVLDKKFSKGISDIGWYQFEKLLSYKTQVIKVNPAYTSQECSKCGHTCKENRLNQADFKCTSCNFTFNSDENASLNILKRGRADLCNAKVVH